MELDFFNHLLWRTRVTGKYCANLENHLLFYQKTHVHVSKFVTAWSIPFDFGELQKMLLCWVRRFLALFTRFVKCICWFHVVWSIGIADTDRNKHFGPLSEFAQTQWIRQLAAWTPPFAHIFTKQIWVLPYLTHSTCCLCQNNFEPQNNVKFSCYRVLIIILKLPVCGIISIQ